MEQDERERLYKLYRRQFVEAMREYQKATPDSYERGYWQGQKNVLRAVLADLAPTRSKRDEWEGHNESAGGCVSDDAHVRSQLRKAMYLIGMIADEGKPHPRVLHEYQQWVWCYRALCEQGIAEPTPDFIGWNV